MKKIIVLGAGGFIGSHLIKNLKSQGHWVCGVDIKYPAFSTTPADQFIITDLTLKGSFDLLPNNISEVYQLAADMGGAGYLFTGLHDANVMRNSVLININTLDYCVANSVKKVFFSSSACVYPTYNQDNPYDPKCNEESVYPAEPDSEYGWEKLFSERLYANYAKNYNLNVRIGRLHNVFGPEGTWQGGKEKAPAAICRKVATNHIVDIWGNGKQTRTFLYIDQCVEGINRLMQSEYQNPVNIGCERLISINDLALLVAKLANKKITINNIPGPIGVTGRSSDNTLIKQVLNWAPKENLEYELTQTYNWILNEINQHS